MIYSGRNIWFPVPNCWVPGACGCEAAESGGYGINLMCSAACLHRLRVAACASAKALAARGRRSKAGRQGC